MNWSQFRSSLAAKALRVDLVDNNCIVVTYLRAFYVPGVTLVRDPNPEPSIETIQVPLMDTTTIDGFDIDESFFNLLAKSVPNSKDDPIQNHIIQGNVNFGADEPKYWQWMMDRMNYRGFVPARLFVSDAIARQLVYKKTKNAADASDIEQNAKYSCVTLTDDIDIRLVGYWKHFSWSPSVPIFRTDKVPDNVMYMTTFADFLGVIPTKTSIDGPTDMALAIMQPCGIAKAEL